MDRSERYAWDAGTKMWYKWGYDGIPISETTHSHVTFQYFCGYMPKQFVLITRVRQRVGWDVLTFEHIEPGLAGPHLWFYAPTRYREVGHDV